MAKTGKNALIFDEQSKRGNSPMPAPHFSQPNTGVASDIGENLGNTNRDLGSLRMKSSNLETNLNSGITDNGD
jgi:hypothetical protein